MHWYGMILGLFLKTSIMSKRNNQGKVIATKEIHKEEKNFDLLVDGVPYSIKAVPFSFNGELRFRISVNGGDEHVFTWDSELGALRAIDDEASTLPSGLEEAISEKLQSIQV